MATRRGRRAGSATLVVHLAQPAGGAQPSRSPVPLPARVGFVVSRACGPAVTRNRIRRRLRHLMLDRLPELPAAAIVVVRALPAAADADSPRLGTDLTGCLDRLLGTSGTGS